MTRSHVARIFGFTLLVVLIAGCALFDREEKKRELLPVRNVRVVPFPVRPLEFEDQLAKQEKDLLTISGSVRNVSYAPVVNVSIRAIVFLAEDQSINTLLMPLLPSVIQPGEKTAFSVAGLVEQPVSHVELHIDWEEYYPPGL
jgi:hypothetical protein